MEKLSDDVDFENVIYKVKVITSVSGGIGLMTNRLSDEEYGRWCKFCI